MRREVKNLVAQRKQTEQRIRDALSKLPNGKDDECNCTKSQPIHFLKQANFGHEVYTYCGNCGGYIADVEHP